MVLYLYCGRTYAVALFCITQRVPEADFCLRQHGTCRSFCVRFFRASRGKTAHDKKYRTALPKAPHANCVSPMWVIFCPYGAKNDPQGIEHAAQPKVLSFHLFSFVRSQSENEQQKEEKY